MSIIVCTFYENMLLNFFLNEILKIWHLTSNKHNDYNVHYFF